MLKVECEFCRAPYQVDERRVPAAGLKMRCPKCGNSFLVTSPSKVEGTGKGPGGMKHTMVGFSPTADGKAGASTRPPPPLRKTPVSVAQAAPLPDGVTDAPRSTGAPVHSRPTPRAFLAVTDDGVVALPATKPTEAKAAITVPPPAVKPNPIERPKVTSPDLPAVSPSKLGPLRDRAQSVPAVLAPPTRPPPAGASAPSFELDLPDVRPDHGREHDLPARSEAGLPATRKNPFGGDLPLAKPALGRPDLPLAKPGLNRPDLPLAKPGLNRPDLPLAKPALGRPALPLAKPGLGRPDLPLAKPGLGRPDLPLAKPELPVIKPRANGDLPSARADVTGPGARPDALDLPLIAGDVRGPAIELGAAPASAGGHVPTMEESLGFGALGLPDANDKSVIEVGPAPAPVPAPAPAAPVPAAAPVGAAFGEIQLPGPAPTAPSPLAAGGFGELDFGAGAGASPARDGAAANPVVGAPAGFGELDFDTDKHKSSAKSAEPARNDGFLQVPPARPVSQLETLVAGKSREGLRERPSRKGPKIAFASVAALVLGGASLQFSSVGAFGYLAIADKLHASDYAKDAAAAADATHKKLSLDAYVTAREAADGVAQLSAASPRSKPLAAYAAFVEFENQARFGPDAGRLARAKTLLAGLPTDQEIPYAAAARAAESLADGDFVGAKAKLEAAASSASDAGVKFDLDILQGLAALGRKDAPGAKQAFEAAIAKDGASARGHWGLARAWFLTKDLAKVKQEVDATLRIAATHGGARTMHAWLAWLAYQDGAAALAELEVVLDDPSKSTMAPTEVAVALAIKGEILLALDRGSDARVAFERAVVLDPQNIAALVGQGQNLYMGGRFTEALTRFDEAVRRDPTNIPGIVGSAMSKVALEQFEDAKKQLVAARKLDPNDMSLALWLARSEEALGDKASAETDYTLATTLARPDHKDAVLAYAAFASFLAAQGRAPEAQAKLDEARKKLQDSATLDRAFGDIAAAQGKFDDAVAYYMAALKKSPKDLATRFRLGATYRRMRKFDVAGAEFDRILEADKDYPGIALERGRLFEESGNVQKALEQFRSAYEKAPNDPDLALRVGAALVAMGKIDEGMPLLLKVKEKRPDSAEVNHFLGRAYLKKGGTDAVEAMRLLQRAVELDPHRAEYQLYVAWAANDAVPAQLGLARASVDKALALDKLLADGYWQRGVIELREGAIDDAIKDLKYALQLKPGRYEAHATLAECYEQKNDPWAASGEWEKAIAGDDTRPFWRFHYGRLLLDRGQLAEAVRNLSFALGVAKDLSPKPGWLPRLAFETGEAHRRSGQKKEAIDAYELYMGLASQAAPDRKDAIAALKSLGAPSASTY